MSMARRHILRLVGSFAAAPMLPEFAAALDYPVRPVRLIVPYGTGSAPDVLARLFGQWMSERLGQSFVVENRPSAGAALGTEAVVRAAADGYTLLLIGAANMIDQPLYDRLGFNFMRDIAPVASFGRGAHVVAVHPSLPVHSIPELIAYARANPGKLNAGSGTLTSTHMAGELFKISTGVDIVHVPYRASALTDLLSGQLQVSFDTLGVLGESIRDGRLRALAVTTATRTERLPGVPTVGEFLPGFEVSSVGGFGAPKDTSFEIIARLNREINAALKDDKIRARLADFESAVLSGSPADFANLLAAETKKWAKVIETANIKPE
jgi:tripartite-type tricarboxylate transporter receptor subunit TctC